MTVQTGHRPAPAPAGVHEHTFPGGSALAIALAQAVAADLRAAIADRGSARLALSGGSTPRRFLEQLAQQPLDWARVTVIPVDERWLPPEHERSNARLLRETLLQGAAAAARFLPLWRPVETPERALAVLQAMVESQSLPLDAVVLGMGEDGHFASLFPDARHLDIGLAPRGRTPVLAVRSASAPEPRMSLTLSVLFTAPALYLHIEGASKRAVYEAALAGAELPIAAALADAPVPVEVYWCP